MGTGSGGQWLKDNLARQVHAKFEDMVRSSPTPSRAERSAYDDLVRHFPMPVGPSSKKCSKHHRFDFFPRNERYT